MRIINHLCLFIQLLIFYNFCNSQIVNGSFETYMGDFSLYGWQNYGGMASNDVPNGGGEWSLELSEGCSWSYCKQTIPIIKDGDIWELCCWAKCINSFGGGLIFWSTDTFYNHFISDTVWTQICITDTFTISEEQDTVSIILNGGGGIIGTGGARFDLVEIKKIGTTSFLDANVSNMDNYILNQNYPNPFNPITTISYHLPKSSFIKLSIYDIKGKLVKTLVNEKKGAGSYSIEWNAENISSGIYFYQIKAGEFISVRKCLVVK